MQDHQLSTFDKLMRRMRRFFSGHPGEKPQQAVVRLFVGAPLLSLVLFVSFGQLPDRSLPVVLSVIAGLFILPFSLLLAEFLAPGPSSARRYLGTVIDTGAITGVLLLGGAAASPLWLAYLWVVTDNAHRYGSRGLYLAIILSLAGFSLVLIGNEYWADNNRLGLSLLVLLAALSLYLSRRLTDNCIPPRRDASPLCDSVRAVDLPTAQQDDRLQERTERQRQHALSGKKILLLSNESGEQQMIKRHLDSWGAATNVYTSIARSFAALIPACERGEPFHALIAVHGQFDIDARQLAGCIRSDPALQELMLIHVGTTPEGTLSDQLRVAGYARLLDKPLDKTLLFDALHSLDTTQLDNIPRVVKLMDHYTVRKSRQPLSILLADRNQNDLRRSKRILQQAGHQVFVVKNGLRILDALESHRFDVAVVSMQLPGVTGLEAFKLYRFTRTDQAWMPFVILLDKVSGAKVCECEDAGVNAVLTKPVVSSQLTEVVENTVQASIQEKIVKGNGSTDTGAKIARAIVIDGLTLDGQRLKELEKLGRGEMFLANLIDNFSKESIQIVKQMEQAVERSDVHLFHDLGHTIKDSAGSLGTVDLYQLGVRATRLYSTDFPDNALRLLEDLRQCCHDSHRALRHYLTSREKFITLHE